MIALRKIVSSNDDDDDDDDENENDDDVEKKDVTTRMTFPIYSTQRALLISLAIP